MKRGNGLILVYVTASTRAEAHRLGDAAVEERLAACVNYLGRIESTYRWKGKLARGKEHALIVKTTARLLPKLIRRVKELHSYECPCVVALKISGGNKGFLEWLRVETSIPEGPAQA